MPNPLDSLQPGEWYDAGAGSKITSVLYPWPSGGVPTTGGAGFPNSLTDTWNSASYDTLRDKLWIVAAGGHDGYGGNESYAFDIATLTWSRPSDPTYNPGLLNPFPKDEWVDIGANINSATNATPIVVSYTDISLSNPNIPIPHVYQTGDYVEIYHSPNTAANGFWSVTRIDDTTISLDGSIGNGTSGSGGILAPCLNTPLGVIRSSCCYPDGSPRPGHNYNAICYIPSVDRIQDFTTFGAWPSSATFVGAGSPGSSKIGMSYRFNPGSPPGWEWHPGMGSSGTAIKAVYDSYTQHVWCIFNNGVPFESGLHEYDPVGETIVNRTSSANQTDYNSKIVVANRPNGQRLLVHVGIDGPGSFGSGTYTYDLTTVGSITPVKRSTSGDRTPETFQGNSGGGGYVGLIYDFIRDRVVSWVGKTGDTRTVYTLNLDTYVWERRVPKNSVAPTQCVEAGTFGRFFYVLSKDVYGVWNHVSENLFFYKMSDQIEGTEKVSHTDQSCQRVGIGRR